MRQLVNFPSSFSFYTALCKFVYIIIIIIIIIVQLIGFGRETLVRTNLVLEFHEVGGPVVNNSNEVLLG